MMNYKYHKELFFLNEKFEVKEKLSGLSLYYKTSFIEDLNIFVTIRVLNGKEDRIYYLNPESVKIIKKYHEINFHHNNLFIIKTNKSSFVVEGYNKFEFTGLEVYQFDSDKREIKQVILNSNYELVQYSESFYSGSNKEPFKEKYFYPTQNWMIHTEEYDD